ncbi:MAG: hypothetical protein V4727_06860 [Verrucomicrobiota bacterium]
MRIFTIIFFATCSATLAQQPVKKDISVTFSLIGWGQAIESIEYRTGGKMEKITDVPLFDKSKPQKYNGSPDIGFFLPKPEIDAEGNPIPAAVASIPTNAERVLILLVSDGNTRYRAIVIPDDIAAVPGGKALLINLCETSVAVRTNKTDSFLLEENKTQLVSPSKNSLTLQMELGVKNLDEWYKVESNFIPLPDKYQTLVFFLQSQSEHFTNIDGNITKPIQIVVLRELVEKTAEKDD